MRLRFQKGDCIAIAVVLLLAVALVIFFLPGSSVPAASVEIYQNGQLVKTMPLSRDDSYTLAGDYTNVIAVKDGKVSMIYSDCPGGDCIHSGSISSTGRSIVCLPNGVEVRIVGKTDNVDFVVG